MLTTMHNVLGKQYSYFFSWSYFFSFDYFCWENRAQRFSLST